MITKIEKYWKYFEVKACALKKEKNLFFAYVKLGRIKGKNINNHSEM